MSLVSIIPKPPKALGLHTASQRTQWYLSFFPFPSQKKRERCPSITLWTPSPNRQTAIAWIARLDIQALVRVSLAAEDISIPIHGSARLATLPVRGSQAPAHKALLLKPPHFCFSFHLSHQHSAIRCSTGWYPPRASF